MALAAPPAGWQWVPSPDWEPGDGEREMVLVRIPGYVAPVGALVRSIDPATGKPVFTMNEVREDVIYIDGVRQVDPGRTPVYPRSPEPPKPMPSRFTPIAKLPATPQAEPPYAGNAPLPVKNPWQTIMGLANKWSWKPKQPRRI